MTKQKSQDISPEKAEILGLLCAEGSHYSYITVYNEFFKNRGRWYTLVRNVEAIEFTNLDKKLLQHFRKLMLKTYNYAPRPTGIKTSMKIRIKKKSVIKDLLKYTDFGSMKWKVPSEIWSSLNEIKYSFIRGLFDGDGAFRSYSISLTSINRDGIINIKKLLNSINIETKISCRKPPGNRKLQYNLYLNKINALKYKELIKSSHHRKIKMLRQIC